MSHVQTSQFNLSKPTLSLKQIDSSSIPDVKEISSENFRNYVYTGIKAVVSTPLAKISKNAMFAVNLDGFIPDYGNMTDNQWSNIFRNLMPIQVFPSALPFIKITQEQIALPQMVQYLSNRFISGSIGVGVRISSNTSQSGNLIITQMTGVSRNFYAPSENYTGLRFLNAASYVTDYSVNNFVLGDASLNRQLSITCTRRDPTRICDFNTKLNDLMVGIAPLVDRVTLLDRNAFSTQFLEDWLVFGILGNLPDQNANQLTFDFFFDFSKMNFYVPIYPVLPSISLSIGRQILDFSSTFNNHGSMTRPTATWLPGPALLDDEELDSDMERLVVYDSPYDF